jgi:asparagine synthase (glutamine-hydrolysing)
MCGICGIYIFDENNQVSENLLLKMRDTMIHRGPDAAGFYISKTGKIGLGHRRLKIIDLSSKANQPMSNEDGTIWIVFNGEVYNFPKLKEELIQKGHTFISNSDTEVIIHLYEEKGIDCIYDLEGEYAFSIFDEEHQKLYLVRDRIGIKPLYYTSVQNKFLFASEIKALLADIDVPRRVNEKALYDYLSFLTTPPPDTLFYGINKLSAGCYIEIDQRACIRQEKYWDVLDKFSPIIGMSEKAIISKIQSGLRDTVAKYKLSDVQVGVFLSGGLDSSINTILFSENEGQPVKTFTIGYEGDNKSYVNEFRYARLIADLIGADHYERSLTITDFFDFISKMIYYQDEPIADWSCMPAYYASKLARDNNIIVCQVGEGADELFVGYPKWLLAVTLERINKIVPRFIKHFGMILLEAVGKTKGLPYEGLRRGISKEPIFWGGAEAFTEDAKKKILSKRLQDKFYNYSSYEFLRPIYENFLAKVKDKHPINWMTYLDLNFRIPDLLCMRVDKMSMAVSLEARVPFLNHKFVEFVMSIPGSMKIRNGNTKYLLKNSFRDIIPNEIINRKKQGFGIPIEEWFSQDFGKIAKEIVLRFCEETDYFNKEEVNILLTRGDVRKRLYLLNFVFWYYYWIQGRDIKSIMKGYIK